MNPQIRKHVISLLNTISEQKIENLKNLLKEGELSLQGNTYELKNKLNLSPPEINLVKKVFTSFTNFESLITVLELLNEIKLIKETQQKNTRLVWTSPFIFHEKADNTLSIMVEMINSAKRSIIIVGYLIQGDTPEIFEALIRATHRGVQIKLLFDRANEYVSIIKRNWKDRTPFPLIYSFKPKTKYSSLHAKFLIKDSDEILVTSANLTGRAVSRNVELGIHHFGEIARDTEELVDSLIQEKYLEKLKC